MTQDALMQRMITAGVNILNPQEVFDFYHSEHAAVEEIQALQAAVSANQLQIGEVHTLAQTNEMKIGTKADQVDLETAEQQIELNRLAILTKADIAALAMLAQLVDTKADQAYVNQQIADLVGSAPEALNTVYELAEAIQDNAGIIDTLNQSVANRVRFDVATQALTEIQKQNARTNIGAEESGTAAMLIAQITAASIGAATAAQGTKADTALQSGDVAPVALSGLFSSLVGQNKIFDVVFGAYALGSNTAVVATDTLGQIIGKLQAQINNVNPSAAMIPVNAQTGTAYTLALTDAGNCIEMNNSVANTLTVPPNSTIPYDIGTTLLIRQMGTGQTTIVADSGVTVRNPHGTLKLSKQYASVALHKRAIDEWCIEGNLAESYSATKTSFETSVRNLFANQEQGFFYDPNDLTTMWQDAAKLLPVTGEGQPVWHILDKSGNNNHAFATSSASRPILQRNATTGAYYLAFDGADDFLQTANIDFTSTDKMSLFTGVTKLADAGQIIAELSPDPTVDAGSFFLVAGADGGGNGYTSLARGLAGIAPSQTALHFTYPAPDVAVLSVKHDISSDLSSMRRNGVIGINGLADKGTGNFGNYPLFIGSRAGTDFSFTGHLYGLIGIGKLVSDNETLVIEKELAKQVGVTL